MAEQINKNRLNELLGIQEGQSFDDYMSEMSSSNDDTQSIIDQTSQLIQATKEKVNTIDDEFRSNIQVIDETKQQIQSNLDNDGSASDRIDALVNVESAFKSIEDLVDTTKQMIANVYGIISSCDVLDSETVGAAASLIGETRQLIGEYTSLYKQRIKFFDQVKLESIKQTHRLELLKTKYELEAQKWKEQHPIASAEVVGDAQTIEGGVSPNGGAISFSTIDMMNMLQELDDEEKAN